MVQEAVYLAWQPGPVAEPSLILGPIQNQQLFMSLGKWAGVAQYSNVKNKPTHIKEGNLFYSKSTKLNVTLIQKNSQKHPEQYSTKSLGTMATSIGHMKLTTTYQNLIEKQRVQRVPAKQTEAVLDLEYEYSYRLVCSQQSDIACKAMHLRVSSLAPLLIRSLLNFQTVQNGAVQLGFVSKIGSICVTITYNHDRTPMMSCTKSRCGNKPQYERLYHNQLVRVIE